MSTRGYVGKLQGCALVKRLFEILNPGVVFNHKATRWYCKMGESPCIVGSSEQEDLEKYWNHHSN